MKHNQNAIKLFLRKESKELRGRWNVNAIVVWAIFFVAVLSIGFGSASLRFLSHKMEDRFVNCIDIIVDQIYSNGYSELDDFLGNSNIPQNYGIEGTERVWLIGEKFLDANGEPCQLDGRSFECGSPVFNDAILSDENTIRRRQAEIQDTEVCVIVSLNGLKKLGVDSAAFLRQRVSIPNKEDILFDIPVAAIVKELPNMCDFIVSKGYLMQEIAEGAGHFDVTDGALNKRLSICIHEEDEITIKKIVENFDTVGSLSITPCLSTWDFGYTTLVVRYDENDTLVRTQLYDSLFALLNTKVDGLCRIYEWGGTDNVIARDPQIYSCFFGRDSLQHKVESFKDDLKQQTGYTLDMNKINSLKNLYYVQTLGGVLSYSIIGIVMVFIIVFVTYLLNSHFEKIQRNLGTFKAFGMNNKVLYGIYGRLIVRMVATMFAFAIVVGLITSLAINTCFSLEEGYSWVNVLVWQNGLLLLLSITASIAATYYVGRRKLRHTPGDLIYRRK